MFFLRKSSLERLPVVMSSVRMGERALQIGIDDAPLLGAIAAKVGLSGTAAVVVAGEQQGSKASAAAQKAGALVDVHVAPFDAMPLAPDSFDVVVIHAGGVGVTLSEPDAVPLLREAHRVLRDGGRVVIIEGGGRGLTALRGTAQMDANAVLGTLGTAGFAAARLLAEREGYRFFEGLKPQR